MHIIGTAGHVDHGKSSLVRALTGTNPDRWLEEQQRGMTLDLGFAHLRFEDGVEAGIVDVPGHERFLHNMLAGAAGMELVLLVVAADEGVMPQTREHLQILRYLNAARTLIVITKADLLSEDDLAFARESIAEALRGTMAQDAPMLPVSTLNGAGMNDLREAIHDALTGLPPRDPDAPAYLPIDRVFALPGHGTIVTGTLMQGRIATGETFLLQPSGARVRARSVQRFGRKEERVDAGSRVAINVPAVDTSQIARGEVLCALEFAPAQTFAVRFTPVAEAVALLRRRNPVRAYAGAAEILGTLVFERVPVDQSECAGVLFLRRAAAVYPGMPFVVRRLSPKTLLGGGRLEGGSQHASAEAGSNAHEAAVHAFLRERGLSPADAPAIAREANLREDAVMQALQALGERGEVIALDRPAAFLESGAANALFDRVMAHVRDVQTREPWSAGVTSLALSRALAVPEPLLLRLLNAFAHDGRIAYRSGYFSSVDHEPQLSAEQSAFFELRVAIDPQAPFVPVRLEALTAAVKQSRIPGLSKAFDTLIAKGTLVKVGDDVYRGSQIAQIRARVEGFLHANERMTMAQFRDLLGTSRKYAVPLLEWFDARGITVRSGDYRMLRRRAPEPVAP